MAVEKSLGEAGHFEPPEHDCRGPGNLLVGLLAYCGAMTSDGNWAPST